MSRTKIQCTVPFQTVTLLFITEHTLWSFLIYSIVGDGLIFAPADSFPESRTQISNNGSNRSKPRQRLTSSIWCWWMILFLLESAAIPATTIATRRRRKAFGVRLRMPQRTKAGKFYGQHKHTPHSNQCLWKLLCEEGYEWESLTFYCVICLCMF